ncbi:MAG: Frataxin homolog CyaY, facilitates Fe-S cluster assembly, interacts with IscS [Olavius algarvensis Gamma 3 endosymbiont]|nr:MAG: Frataxin homolog CyaY, facilitates Fe-S cluster assembly, interacts with IscS [Olavius algarvensis Gamma 3 endosymbiont]
MNESDFDRLAEETLVAVEEALDDCGVDIDYDNAGGILTLEFTNGSQIIINKQAPLTQIWVAARSGGFHFDYDAAADCWRLANGEELFDCLEVYCSDQAGEAVTLKQP